MRSAREAGGEVQRLGSRINEMVVGLRTREVLTRYVSRATAEAAHGAARLPSLASVAPSGERRPMAVLFSDVRGFTAFSERVAPEAVVELVNRYLAAQAEAVGAHGGDVDKFVGDELMAVFDGPDAAGRAVLCALSLVDAVDRARRGGDEPRVGVGVAFGEVVAGSVGSPARMDFTVMGDVVNTAARLVGAASAGEVLVTEAVRDACSAGPACPSFVPLPPLVVKGKREPLTVFRALGPALYSRK
ncbi:MAG: adenylate/guanylate cyclase domain-containing protein [Acidobacteria bacterium ACB2]|nr:adenylate/guanylate cyclase domain-containing protein [Acidobacteria bacterium ACB2]